MVSAQPGLVHSLSFGGVTLRPIGPRDVGVLQAYVRGLSPESRYDRFFGALSELPLAELDRVIHLDQKYQLARRDPRRWLTDCDWRGAFCARDRANSRSRLQTTGMAKG